MKITDLVHNLLKPYLSQVKVAVDATLGNGYDTLFLAENCPQQSKIFAFDLQNQAIKESGKLLNEKKINNVELIQKCHSCIQECLANHEISEIDLAIFNFGYLPGGDKAITTMPETSIAAIQQCLNALTSQGILSLTLYPGHETGAMESEQIKNFFKEQNKYKIFQTKIISQTKTPPPEHLLLQKNAV